MNTSAAPQGESALEQSALDALGDSTRRRILELLRPGPSPVGAIAEQLPVSRPAVSKHLKVLGESGLVTHVRVGTSSLYRIDTRGLEAVRSYLDGFWTDVLTAFADHVDDCMDDSVDNSQTNTTNVAPQEES